MVVGGGDGRWMWWLWYGWVDVVAGVLRIVGLRERERVKNNKERIFK